MSRLRKNGAASSKQGMISNYTANPAQKQSFASGWHQVSVEKEKECRQRSRRQIREKQREYTKRSREKKETLGISLPGGSSVS